MLGVVLIISAGVVMAWEFGYFEKRRNAILVYPDSEGRVGNE